MAIYELIMSFASMSNIIIACLLLYLLHLWWNKKSLHLPPGPMGIPILGSLPFMDVHAEKTFGAWSEKYGPVISVQLGSHRTIVLNSKAAIEEAFLKQGAKFNARYSTFFTNFASRGLGIMFLNGEETWKAQRRFGLRALAGHGMHGKSLEERVLHEVDALCEVIRSKNGKPFILEVDLMASIANIITGIMLNERCAEEENESFRKYAELVVEGFREHGMLYSLLSVIPWCRHFPYARKQMEAMKTGIAEGNAIFDHFIDQHLDNLDPLNTRDFTDLYLVERKRKTASFQDLQQLRFYLKDMFAAGTETTTSTIRWIIFIVIKYPGIQKRIHEEIDSAIGRAGKVRVDLDLPYTKAVIQETYRARTTTPLGVPRCTTEDVKLMGYDIPKNTQILANIWQVHNDPTCWPNPETFDPERHLDEQGNFVKNENVIPFSIGARNCLGENLARMEVFLFVVSLLQKYKVSSTPENPNPPEVGISGVVNSAPHYPIIMEER